MLAGGAVGLLAAALALVRVGAPENLELALYDTRAASGAAGHPASPGVVLVGVDEGAVRLAGGAYPLPRSALAAVIEEAFRAGARVVALDFILEDPLEGSLAGENEELERAIASGPVALAAAIPPAEGAGPPGPAPGGESSPADPRVEEIRRRHARPPGGAARGGPFVLSPPLPRFALAAAALGGVSIRPAPNGRVYALRHVYPAAEGEYLSLPLAAAWLARGRPEVRLDGDVLHFGSTLAPVAPDGTTLLRFFGPHDGTPSSPATYPLVSAGALLQARLAREGAADPPPPAALAPLSGSVAVVCVTLAGTKDRAPTPVNPSAVGGEVIATAVDDLLRGTFVRRHPPWVDASIAFALSLASAALVAFAAARAVRPWTVAMLSAAGTAALLAAWWWVTMLALERGTWLPALAPMAGAFGAAFAADLRLFALERRDRRFVHDALGRYTSPALVDTLLRNRALLDRFGGARQELTAYFSDIRGFTTLSERMDPEDLVALLNDYLGELTGIIERHGGYVDKYIGDAIMAIWGAPVPSADHAARACAAALEMRDAVERLRPGWKERFGVEIHAGAGINTGPMVAGNVGSRRKTNYTVLGDGVNLASRLEGATKVYGVPILVGEGTRAAAGEAFAMRSLDVLRVKGKDRGVEVFELVARADALPAGRRAFLARWAEAVGLYRAARFAEALAAFEELRQAEPGDLPAAIHADRCRGWLAAPPGPDWSPLHVLHEK